MLGLSTPGLPVFLIDDRQDYHLGTLARRESQVAVVDVPIDAARGVTRRMRTHARYVIRAWV